MEFIDDGFCDFSGFVQQCQIRGVGNVLGADRGIKDYFTFMSADCFRLLMIGREFVFFFTVLAWANS